MTRDDVERFVERFKTVWAAPEPESFALLWQPEGTLSHPSMERSIAQAEIPDYLRRVKSVLPDISLEVRHWAATDNVVLIEWTITATFQREPIEWSGADRFILRGDRAVEGVAYFDTTPLWNRFDPDHARGDLLAASTASPAGA
jgi:hypothetical protein